MSIETIYRGSCNKEIARQTCDKINTSYEVGVSLATSKPKKRKACQQDGSQDQPIIIDESEPPRKRRLQSPINKELGKASDSSQTIQKTSSVTTTIKLAPALLESPQVLRGCWSAPLSAVPISDVVYTPAQQLSSYDDILTDMLIDKMYYKGTVRKYCDVYSSAYNEQERVIPILRDLVIKDKNLPEAESRLLSLPCFKGFYNNLKSATEKTNFRRHMRKYLKMYLPDCVFEISGTNRYTIISYEARIIARNPIKRGEEIRYLEGTRAIMTMAEDRDEILQDFSVIKTSRNNATSYLCGPASFLNHDCDSNARFVTTGTSRMSIVATSDIEIGNEITVPYDKDFFGIENCDCLCKTCEDWCRNGWSKKDQAHCAVEIEPRYPSRQKKVKPKGTGGLFTSLGLGLHLPVDIRASPGPKGSLRVPGDYLCFASKITWTHLQECLVDTSLRSDSIRDSCPMCTSHRNLYGYHWPKTKPKGRQDIEERRYF